MCRLSSLLVLASVLVAVGCDDPTNPAGPSTEVPSTKISDGRFAGGNDDFFFLPPIMPDPKGTANYDAGAFNALLGPTVKVCQLAANPATNPATDCALDTDGQPILVASFTSNQVQGSVSDENYRVNWNTDDSNLFVDRFYRLQVFLGSVRIGFADIDPVSSGRDLKNANTGEGIPLVDGRTLPVKFRIENGVLCENKSDCGEFRVTNDGGTFLSNTKDAAIQFQAGFLPEGVSEITLTIERVTVGSANNCHGDAGTQLWKQFEGCYEITSDPDLEPFGGIQKSAIAAQCVEVSPTDPLFPYLAPYKSRNGRLERLRNAPQTFLDCEGFSGSTASVPSSNPLVRFASSGLRQLGNGLGRVFGVRTAEAIDLGLGEELPIGSALSRFNWAIGLEADASGGTEQSAGFGLPAAQPLEVHVATRHFHAGDIDDEEDGHAQDIADVEVVFTVDEGDGYFELDEEGIPVREKSALSNADGRASVSFTAASNQTANVVVASVPRLQLDEEDPPPPLTFSITGLASDLVIENLTRSIAEPNTGDPLSWSFDVSNVGQGIAIASTARLVVSLEEGETETVASFDVSVPTLNPGESVTLSTPVLAGPRDIGDHSVIVMANATSAVVEATDENNTAAQDFTVLGLRVQVIGEAPGFATVESFIEPVTVVLRDANGSPVPDAVVTFAVTRGGGILTGSTVTTNSAGIATLGSWQLGPTPTMNIVEARATGASTARVSVLGTWRQRFAVGWNSTCALTSSGQVLCWGDNSFGQLGSGVSGSPSSAPIATPVPSLNRLTTTNGMSFCGFVPTGAVMCWGRAAFDMLMVPSVNSSPPVMLAGGPFSDVTVGRLTACGLGSAGIGYCWGANQRGEIGSTAIPVSGPGFNSSSATPVVVEGGLTFSSIVAGWIHACGLTTEGAAYCWGAGEYLGTGGTATNSRVPVPVAGGHLFTKLAVGPHHTCGLTADGRALCWGLNTKGQLGNGSQTGSGVPVAVAGGLRFSSISVSDEIVQPAGVGHTCALTDEGQPYCWGANERGQLGDGTTINRSTPTAVGGGLRLTALELGALATCGMRGDTIWCWGANNTGQLGDGTTVDRGQPVRVGAPFN